MESRGVERGAAERRSREDSEKCLSQRMSRRRVESTNEAHLERRRGRLDMEKE